MISQYGTFKKHLKISLLTKQISFKTGNSFKICVCVCKCSSFLTRNNYWMTTCFRIWWDLTAWAKSRSHLSLLRLGRISSFHPPRNVSTVLIVATSVEAWRVSATAHPVRNIKTYRKLYYNKTNRKKLKHTTTALCCLFLLVCCALASVMNFAAVSMDRASTNN